MNRHERRRARKAGHNSFVANYVRHLPEVPLDAPGPARQALVRLLASPDAQRT